MAQEDFEALEELMLELQFEIEEELIPKRESDAKNCLLEVR